MQLFLVRHGQTEWNRMGRAQGHTDIPLDEVGLAQASALAQAWTGTTPLRLLSSDLQRSRVTAEALALRFALTVELDSRLRETSFGELEGQDYLEVRRKIVELGSTQGVSEFDVRPPGGESRADVWARLDAVVNDLRDAFQSREPVPTLVVGHGGALTLLLARLLDGTPATARGFILGNTSVTELHARTDGGWRLLRYNDTAHLAQPSAPMVDTGAPTAR